MIEEHAVVIQCKQGAAELEIERRTACSICGQRRGCGNATWGKMLGHKSHTFLAENSINAQVGDSVVVGIDERVALRSVFLLYVLPLVCLIFFSVLAEVLFNNQLYVMLAAIFGLCIGFAWVKWHLMGRGPSAGSDTNQYQAVVLRYADDDVANDT